MFEKATHAALYSKYRPTYPKSIIKLMLDYLLKHRGSQEFALDVGCGSGQSTFLLQEHFKQCLGIDISRAQIKEAQEKASSMELKNVKFSVGEASELPVETGTVDLVTAATSWHWFPDKTKFHSECKRVLKPNGCLAVYSYSVPHFPASYCSMNKSLDQFYFGALKEYRHDASQVAFNEYQGVELPFHNVERHNEVMFHKMSVANFIGYLSSLSSYQNFCEAHPGSSALEELEQSLISELTAGTCNSSAHKLHIDIQFTLFAILGQNG